MKNKSLYYATIAAFLAATSADAKTVVKPVGSVLDLARYSSASTIVVTGSQSRMTDILSTLYPDRTTTVDEPDLVLFEPAGHFSLSRRPEQPISRAASGIAVPTPPATTTSPPAASPPSVADEASSTCFEPPSPVTAEAGIRTHSVEIPSLSDLIRKSREKIAIRRELKAKSHVPGKYAVLPLDRGTVHVCIAARLTRVPHAWRRPVHQHLIAAKYALPLTRAEIEKKKTRSRDYRLGYARRAKHMRRLSPDRIHKLKFYPPLRRFDTDMLSCAAEVTVPILTYVPVPTDERAPIYSGDRMAGVQRTIHTSGACNNDIIGMPAALLSAWNLGMHGNVPAKTTVDLQYFQTTEMESGVRKSRPSYINVPVALRNIPRGGLCKVTFEELGHSPPYIRA